MSFHTNKCCHRLAVDDNWLQKSLLGALLSTKPLVISLTFRPLDDNWTPIMAKAHIVNIVVLDNPSAFFNPFQFEITFECIEDLKEDLEWKIIYVGSAESEDYDQTLDTVFVGPVPEGRHMFVFQADPPDPAKIPVADAVGVTVVLLTCSYRGKEFIRVGYYVNNEYTESDPSLRENPPTVPLFDKLQRNVLATNPRVTRFKIDWGDNPCDDPCQHSEPIDETNEQMITEINGNNNTTGNAVNSDSSAHISEDSVGPLKPVVCHDSNHSQSMEVA